MRQIVSYADSAAAMARANDLNFVIENGTEPLYGKEGEYYGLADVLERTDDQVGWLFDTANPFSVSRTPSSPMSVLAFLEDYLDNLFYIHLKSAENGNPQPVLMDNPLAFEKVFEIINKGKITYVAIELQAVDDEKRAYANMEESIEFLRKNGLLKNF
jgi:sugar phosphate isomerase/epimerase